MLLIIVNVVLVVVVIVTIIITVIFIELLFSLLLLLLSVSARLDMISFSCRKSCNQSKTKQKNYWPQKRKEKTHQKYVKYFNASTQNCAMGKSSGKKL